MGTEGSEDGFFLGGDGAIGIGDRLAGKEGNEAVVWVEVIQEVGEGSGAIEVSFDRG